MKIIKFYEDLTEKEKRIFNELPQTKISNVVKCNAFNFIKVNCVHLNDDEIIEIMRKYGFKMSENIKLLIGEIKEEQSRTYYFSEIDKFFSFDEFLLIIIKKIIFQENMKYDLQKYEMTKKCLIYSNFFNFG